MELWDGLITFTIIAAATCYLYRKCRKVEHSSGCGNCSDGGSCCSGQYQEQKSACKEIHH